MSSVALICLIAWADSSPGTSSITIIQFGTYSVVRSSVGWKTMVADVINLLLNLTDSALSMLTVTLPCCASCAFCVLSAAGWATKFEDRCDVSKPPAFHWFEDTPSKLTAMSCVWIASNACDAVSMRVLLPMWGNSLSEHMEVNVIDNRADISLELTTTRTSCRAAP